LEPFEPRVAASGAWGTVEFAVRPNGKSPAEAFLDESPIPDRAIFVDLFQQMADFGHTHNPSRFSPERRRVYGFKAKGKSNKLIRLACFQISNRWILTHGFFKRGAQRGKGPWPPEELDKADRIMSEHLVWEANRKKENGR
jgi:hypothetical protein